MERCLDDSAQGKEAISLAWYFTKKLETEAEQAGRVFEVKDLLSAISDIGEALEKGAAALWGTDDFSKIGEGAGFSYEYEQFSRRYCPPEA
jgi:hypothetical protein